MTQKFFSSTVRRIPDTIHGQHCTVSLSRIMCCNATINEGDVIKNREETGKGRLSTIPVGQHRTYWSHNSTITQFIGIIHNHDQYEITPLGKHSTVQMSQTKLLVFHVWYDCSLSYLLKMFSESAYFSSFLTGGNRSSGLQDRSSSPPNEAKEGKSNNSS